MNPSRMRRGLTPEQFPRPSLLYYVRLPAGWKATFPRRFRKLRSWKLLTSCSFSCCSTESCLGVSAHTRTQRDSAIAKLRIPGLDPTHVSGSTTLSEELIQDVAVRPVSESVLLPDVPARDQVHANGLGFGAASFDLMELPLVKVVE